MQVAEPFVFSLIDLLGAPEILANSQVTGRLLLALSQILQLSRNHWQVKRMTQ